MLESKSHLTPRLEADIRDNNAEMEKLAVRLVLASFRHLCCRSPREQPLSIAPVEYNEEELNHLTRRPQKETKDKLDAQYKEVEGQLRVRCSPVASGRCICNASCVAWRRSELSLSCPVGWRLGPSSHRSCSRATRSSRAPWPWHHKAAGGWGRRRMGLASEGGGGAQRGDRQVC